MAPPTTVQNHKSYNNWVRLVLTIFVAFLASFGFSQVASFQIANGSDRVTVVTSKTDQKRHALVPLADSEFPTTLTAYDSGNTPVTVVAISAFDGTTLPDGAFKANGNGMLFKETEAGFAVDQDGPTFGVVAFNALEAEVLIERARGHGVETRRQTSSRPRIMGSV